MINKILYILIICISSFSGLAQPDNASVETIDGKKYYVHFVQAGNTLYGIHQLYKTPLEKILNANEGLENELAIGQKILIPIDPENGNFYKKHTIKNGETLYGIAKQYNCSVSDLQNLNTDLSGGIKPGQQITVPPETAIAGEGVTTDPVILDKPSKTYELLVSDSVVNHVVLKHETLYAISKRYMVSMDTIKVLNSIRGNNIKPGETLVIPVKKVNYEILEKDISKLTVEDTNRFDYESVVSKMKKKYKVAVLMPFMFDANDAIMGKSLRIGEDREMHSLTKVCFEFYQGFKLAADSLAKAGLNVEILIYDTKKDSNEVIKIFNKPEMSDVDLIVGPLYEYTINKAVSISSKRNLNIVLPFKSNMNVLHKNPHVFATVSSDMTLYDGVVDHVVKNYSAYKIILLKPQYGNLDLYNRVRDRYNEKIATVSGAYSSKIVDVSMGSSSGKDINTQISKDTVNVVIVPSTDVKIVSGCMNRLNKIMNINSRSKNLKIIVFGVEDWNKIEDLDILHRVRLNQHYASYRYIDFNSAKGFGFIKPFRASFGVDPTIYSIQGYDVGAYFLGALKLYGVNFESYIQNNTIPQIQNKFKFVKISDESGYENRGSIIVRYNGYQLQAM